MKFLGTIVDRGCIQGCEETMTYKEMGFKHDNLPETPIIHCGDYDWPYFCKTKSKGLSDSILRLFGYIK